MPNRDITDVQQVTNVVADEPTQIAPIAQEVGDKIVQQSEQAKINDSISQAQLELRQAQNNFKTQYASDPFNEDGLNEMNKQQQAIFDKYGDQISPYFKNQWVESSLKIGKLNDSKLEAWGFKQSAFNSKSFLGSSMQTNLGMANQDGEDLATGAIGLPEVMANYAASNKQLQDYGTKNIGGEATEELTKNYQSDYMKSVLAGVATTNPTKAAQLLDSPEVKENFTTDQIGEFTNLIDKTKKEQTLKQSLQQTFTGADMNDLVNDPKTSFYDKRLKIDQMELNNQIPKDLATQGRRVLTSQKAVDAVTDTPVMADIVTRIYDLNSNSDSNSSDYLQGIQNVQADIAEKQANGQLSTQDAKKMNDEVRTLTSKRMSDATKAIGNDFSDANSYFQTTLPPEYRGQATRSLFYQSAGQNFSKDQYKQAAYKIVDDINQDQRHQAVQTLKGLQGGFSDNNKTSAVVNQNIPDDQFLEEEGITPDEVSQTAQNRGMSEQDVIRALRKKKGK